MRDRRVRCRRATVRGAGLVAALLLTACGGGGDAEEVDDTGAEEVDDTGTEATGGDSGGDSCDVYENARVTFIVPGSPGGGFDVYARAIEPYLAEELGGATVVVDNRTGAGGLLATNDLFNTEEPDGMTFEIWQLGSLAAAQFQEDPGANFDLREFEYVGNLGGAEYIWTVGADSGIDSVEDVREAGEHSFATTGRGAGNYTTAFVLSEALGIDADLVTGYEATPQAQLGVIQGDVDGQVGPLGTSLSAIEDGDLVPIMQLSSQPAEGFEDLPMPEDLALDTDAEELLMTHLGLQDLFRVVMAPPGTPEDRLECLRGAFARAAANPEYQELIEQQGYAPVFTAGEQIDERLPELLDPPEAYRELLLGLAEG